MNIFQPEIIEVEAKSPENIKDIDMEILEESKDVPEESKEVLDKPKKVLKESENIPEESDTDHTSKELKKVPKNNSEELKKIPKESEHILKKRKISDESEKNFEELKQIPEESKNNAEELEKILKESENISEETKMILDESENILEELKNIPEESESISRKRKKVLEESENISEEPKKGPEKSENITEEPAQGPINHLIQIESVRSEEESLAESIHLSPTMDTTAKDETQQKQDTETGNTEDSASGIPFEPKLIVKNTNLITEIFQKFHPYPNTWGNNKCNTPYRLVELSQYENEYKGIEAKFKQTCSSYKIVKIERIENPILAAQFKLTKSYKESLNKCKIQELFHGTRSEFLDSICKNNLDWRKIGATGFLKNKFGNGVSFSPTSNYASSFPRGRSEAVRKMLLCDAIVSCICLGDCGTMFPREPFDATGDSSGNVVVKYDDNEYYPKYIIHYN